MSAGGVQSALSLVPTRVPTEMLLVERLRSGETVALGETYDRHHGAVRSMARRLLADDAAAEDLVHDVFVSLPSAIRRFDGGSSLRTFLLAVAVNHARHHARGAGRRRAAMDRLAAEPSPRSADPEQQADRAGLARALARSLDRLPVEQRFAFILCDVEERTSGEAGVLLGVPEATVRTRLHHARRKLRLLLEQEGYR
jgi:RNA polymerase sigma-70 factor (ECF subfamily)